MLAEQRAAHRRALDVPARAPHPVLRRPRRAFRIFRLRAFPQHEIERILLRVVRGDALARAQVVERLARQLPVVRELAHRVIDVAVGRLVRVAVRLERLDHAEHLRDELGRARLDVGPLDAERAFIVVHRADEPVGQRLDRLAVLDRAADDLVVDVGNVAHIRDPVADRTQPALDEVEHDQHARVAHVTIVVYGDSAYVHPHFASLARHEDLLVTRERVADAQ